MDNAYIVKIDQQYFSGYGIRGRVSKMRLFANAKIFALLPEAQEVVTYLRSVGFDSVELCECGVV